MVQVHPVSVVRQRLSEILARFRQEGAAAEPVIFGSHGKPEAILLPYQVYERCEALSRQRSRLDTVLSVTRSVQVELPGPFAQIMTGKYRRTPDHEEIDESDEHERQL